MSSFWVKDGLPFCFRQISSWSESTDFFPCHCFSPFLIDVIFKTLMHTLHFFDEFYPACLLHLDSKCLHSAAFHPLFSFYPFPWHKTLAKISEVWRPHHPFCAFYCAQGRHASYRLIWDACWSLTLLSPPFSSEFQYFRGLSHPWCLFFYRLNHAVLCPKLQAVDTVNFGILLSQWYTWRHRFCLGKAKCTIS